MSNQNLNMLNIARRYKHFDVATYYRLVVVLFCISKSVALEVIDRNLDQAHLHEQTLLARTSTNNNDSRIDPKVFPKALVTADRTSRSVVFVDEYRQLEVDHKLMRSLESLLINSTEVTLLTTIKQHPDNTGTIIALDVDLVRLMEIASHGPTSEMGIFFQGGNNSYVQRFPYRFDEDPWHKLAITLETHRVVIRINCKAFFEYPLPVHELGMLRWRNISLWIGKRNDNSIHNAEQSKGAFGEVQVKAGHDAYLSQCNYKGKSTPLQQGVVAVDQLYKLQNQVDSLENALRLLTTKVVDNEIRLAFWENQNGLSCHSRNGSGFHENQTWEDDCKSCTCIKGMAVCEEIVCDAQCMEATNMIPPDGQCCPVCKKTGTCKFMGASFETGQTAFVKAPRACLECHCLHGNHQCRPIFNFVCPELKCPPSEQMEEPGSCCMKCKEKHRCGQMEQCHADAVCKTMHGGEEVCECKKGFIGNETHCQDFDECSHAARRSASAPICRSNTVCTNLPGSFSCDCRAGYERINPWSCRDVNECQRKSDRCHENAKCLNTDGSYNCQCMDGYEGDGFNCTPICEPACQNEGHCVAPNTCACKGGFFGPECQVDVDECAFNISRCKNNSHCVNIPGSFFCDCVGGYEPVNIYAQEPVCRDIDECSAGKHTCPSLSRCENLDGSWKCVCLGNESCDLSCSVAKELYEENLPDNICDNCSCQEGVWRCQPLNCDCKNNSLDPDQLTKCCPNCNVNVSSVPFCFEPNLNVTYPSGSAWFDFDVCQACECTLGEILCLDVLCPPLQCDNQTQPAGSCCPKCQPTDAAQNSPDPCFDKTLQKKITPIKFGCEEQIPGNSTFFSNWHFDICELCDCSENRICCAVHNDCVLKSRANVQKN